MLTSRLASPLPAGAALVLALVSACGGSGGDSTEPPVTPAPALACATRTNVASCANGATAERNLGALAPAACHAQCQVALGGAGLTAGCWVLASGTCYCRSGSVTSGGTSAGGACALAAPRICAARTDLLSCTQGSVPEIDLGVLGSTACRDRCETSLGGAGVGAGCWIVAGDGHCYCRSGAVNGGGTRSGGACFAPAPLACTSRTDLSVCTQGAVPEINLGGLSAAACHDACQGWMAGAEMTSGCWIVAGDGNCYCRSGAASGGGARAGGSCT